MKNWEVLQKKISEMSKNDFITFAREKLYCDTLRNILGINEDCNECKYFFNSALCKKILLESEYQSPKQEKWVVHRTLRTQNRETYVGYKTHTDYDYVKCGYTMVYQKEYAKRYDKEEAIFIRDLLNKDRQGKQYLWVISKVEE